MKKYVKPELFCESFELAQHIAACDYDSNDTHDDVKTCSFTDGDLVLFVDGNSSCKVVPEGYCYTNGADNLFNLFNS